MDTTQVEQGITKRGVQWTKFINEHGQHKIVAIIPPGKYTVRGLELPFSWVDAYCVYGELTINKQTISMYNGHSIFNIGKNFHVESQFVSVILMKSHPSPF